MGSGNDNDAMNTDSGFPYYTACSFYSTNQLIL